MDFQSCPSFRAETVLCRGSNICSLIKVRLTLLVSWDLARVLKRPQLASLIIHWRQHYFDFHLQDFFQVPFLWYLLAYDVLLQVRQCTQFCISFLWAKSVTTLATTSASPMQHSSYPCPKTSLFSEMFTVPFFHILNIYRKCEIFPKLKHSIEFNF